MPIRPEDLASNSLLGDVAESLLRRMGALVEPAPGDRIGPFRIVDVLGRGGMATVFLAERDDGEYQQRVALKWIVGEQGDETSRQLFRRERQALADLNHPNIARLLEGGHTAEGRPWLAMELVEGAHIDEHARAAGLGLRQRLALFAQLCGAVAYAHGRGMLHRDIKPSNVLVDGSGRVKLLDFGITHLTDDEDELATGAHTPGYASPEQRRGDRPTAAADVWQLGRLLERLLADDVDQAEASTRGTGATATARAAALDGAPATTTTAAARSGLPGDLRAVLAKATALDPGQRYATVDALAADVAAFLAGRPVQAVGGGSGYRLRRFVARNRIAVLAATAGVLVLAATAVTSAQRVRVERDLAQAAADRAAREAATAQAINQFLSEDLIRAADPFGVNAQDAPISELIELAIARVEPRLSGQPAIAAELYAVLGETLLNLGKPEPAARAIDLAIERLVDSHGVRDPRVLRQRLKRAEVESYAGRYDSMRTQLLALQADVADLDDRLPLVIDVDRHLAWNDFVTGDYDAAIEGFMSAHARARPRPDDLDPVAALDRAAISAGLSLALARSGRYAEALVAAEEARALRAEALGTDHPETLASGFAIATALAGLDRLKEASDILGDMDRRFGERFGPDHSQSTLAAHEFGVSLARLERNAEAIDPLQRAVDGRLAVYGPASGNTMNSMAALAQVQARADQPAAAAATVAAIWAGGYVGSSRSDRVAEGNLRRVMGEIALATGDDEAARAECESASALVETQLPATHPLRLQIAACLAVANWRQSPGDAQRHRALLEVDAALAAGPRTGDWWRRQIALVLAGSDAAPAAGAAVADPAGRPR